LVPQVLALLALLVVLVLVVLVVLPQALRVLVLRVALQAG
jgi:hypothetical protein